MRYFGVVVPLFLAMLEPGRAAAFDDGGVVAYHPWKDETVTINLQQHKGKYVELLLPPDWETGLTAQERRTIIDRADIVYQYYKEIMQAEPRLPSRPSIGMLRIAVNSYVPSEYVAWTQNGNREMEIRSDADVLAIFKNELAAGLETNRQVMIHEMGHAFDIYAGYLEYDNTCKPDTTNWCHAWTDIWDPFIPYYGRVSGIRETVPSPDLDLTADAHQRWWTDHSYLPYYRNLSANWENAVKVEDFLSAIPRITARDSWAGIMDRYVQLYGVETMPRVMAYLKDYAAANPAPTTPEGKEYLHIATMADAAHANLSCFLDEWRWFTDEGLADKMELLYGPAANNVLCHDVDGDGFSPLQGDCNDASAAVHPGVTETMNGVDDDCNGLVDDVTPPPAVPVPLAPWAALAAPVKDGVNYVFASSKLTLAAPIVNDTPTQIRFWVTGLGVVGTVPYADEASFHWTPPVDLPAGTYGYRAQLLSATKPVSDFTPLRWFDYHGPCSASSECNDGNACTVDVCTASGLCSNTLVTDDVYEAETMSHSTGNAYPGGWNIYSNGYISFNHAFAGGLQTMTVRAAGQNGFGWPNMRVTVGGIQVFNGLVETTAWRDFTFSFSTPPVSSEVRVYFTNDFYADPVDRNLLVDKVTLAAKCGPGGTPTPINLGPLNQQTTFTVNGAQALVIDQLTFSGWTPTRIVVGIGHTDTQTLDGVSVSVSGGSTTALSGDWQTITIPFTGQSVINLTMNSATSHALRTQWWAQ
jgi:hypothetical protein